MAHAWGRMGESEIPTFAVLTSSDRGARGEREDLGGDAVIEVLEGAGFQLTDRAMVPDDREAIASRLREWADSGKVDLICTTGGTGLGPRDVTPEAAREVIDFEVPGMAEAIRLRTSEKTPFAMISRGVTGVRGGALIINLPGNPKGARECLEVVLPVLSHAVEVLQGGHGPHPVPGTGE